MAATSTDDDSSVEPSTTKTPAWLKYEMAVADELALMSPSATQQHNAKRPGLSGENRQLDVLVESPLVGINVRVVAECKRYVRPLGIGKVDEFIGKLIDVGASYGILYAYSGVTKPAQARADATAGLMPHVVVRDLTPVAAPVLPWPIEVRQALKFGDCGNENCILGDVDWGSYPQDDGTSVQAGACNACGTWSVNCDCGEQVDFFTDDETCGNCGTDWSKVSDGDGVTTGVERISTPYGGMMH